MYVLKLHSKIKTSQIVEKIYADLEKSYEAYSRDLRKLATAACRCPVTNVSINVKRTTISQWCSNWTQAERAMVAHKRPKQILNRLIMKHLRTFIRIFKHLNSKSATVYGDRLSWIRLGAIFSWLYCKYL